MSLYLQETLQEIIGNLRFALNYATTLNATAAAGNVGADTIISANNNLVALKSYLASKPGTGGLAAYIQNQYNNAAFNLGSAFTACQTAITNAYGQTQALINLGAPYVVNGGTNTIDAVQYTTSQTANLRMALTNLISALNGLLPG